MKKFILFAALIFSSFSASSQTSNQTLPSGWTTPQKNFLFSYDFILQQVIARLKQTYNAQLPLPDIKMSSESNLADFQKDLHDQWHMDPPEITNAYAAHANRIYIIDDMDYYKRNNRCIDDSLAHEFTHYVQVHYKHIPIEQFDDSMEWEAVDVQTWFRKTFCKLSDD